MAPDQPHDPTDPQHVPGVNEPWDAQGPPPPPGRVPGPRPDDEVRMWTIIAHASALPAAVFGLAFMGPLVVWLLRREADPVSGAHAKEALHFNLTVLLWAVLSFVLMLALIGFAMIVVVGIFWFVNVVRATAAVANGRTFRYPLTLRLF